MKAHKSGDNMPSNDTRIALLEQSITHVHETLHRIETVMADGFNKIHAEISGVREELKGEIQDVRGDLKGEIKNLRGELKGEIKDLREEVKEVRKESWSQFKWIIGSFLFVFGSAVFTLVLKSLHWIA